MESLPVQARREPTDRRLGSKTTATFGNMKTGCTSIGTRLGREVARVKQWSHLEKAPRKSLEKGKAKGGAQAHKSSIKGSCTRKSKAKSGGMHGIRTGNSRAPRDTQVIGNPRWHPRGRRIRCENSVRGTKAGRLRTNSLGASNHRFRQQPDEPRWEKGHVSNKIQTRTRNRWSKRMCHTSASITESSNKAQIGYDLVFRKVSLFLGVRRRTNAASCSPLCRSRHVLCAPDQVATR